eukprot:CAMPEP_0117680704 /NCGR_PEP_ID=MMETSP0804-20121206/18517_1 /TAXON_ID=1074897 /ORGANISM="Tetraselmis astigmatica, Strain CCMP880" /LENGTH=43 /DNA_ID= /DNA_START= /DNA_END= /DNA_ORIENTATION=
MSRPKASNNAWLGGILAPAALWMVTDSVESPLARGGQAEVCVW